MIGVAGGFCHSRGDKVRGAPVCDCGDLFNDILDASVARMVLEIFEQLPHLPIYREMPGCYCGVEKFFFCTFPT